MEAMAFNTVVEHAMAQADGAPVRERVRARFSMEPELDVQASQEQNRPVYKMTEFVHIRAPGVAYEERFRANEQHRKRFAREYHWFHDTEKEPTEGQPIEEWNCIPKSKAAELKWAGIKTVEELAKWSLDDRPLNSENAALVGLAQDYLDGMTQKDREIRELQAQLAELTGKRGAGRPKKESIDDASDDGPGGS